MIIHPRRFKNILLVGLDLDLVSELRNNKINIKGYTFNKPKKKSGLKYLGSIKEIKKINKNTGILVADSSIEIKKFVYNNFKKNICNFISQHAILPKKNKIGLGSIIQSNTFISENVLIGNCVKINVGCQIHHDVEIGDFTILGPNSVVLGDTKIKEDCFIGSSSTIRNKITVLSNTFLKMGTVLTKSTLTNSVYYGNPGKLQKNEIK